jgi:tripartite-type tricarboxylate transporter receptor subunit TctC
MPSVLAVNADVPARTSAELLALLKREPGKFNYGSIGNGSLSHLAMEAIALKSGTQLVHIPYGSSPQAVTALIRGDVQIVCLPAASVMSQVQTGKVRALAVTSPKRSALLPEIPTLAEAGMPEFDLYTWFGMFAPSGTPPEAVARIQREVVAGLKSPDVLERFAAVGAEPVGSTPGEFVERIRSDAKKWGEVIRAGNIKAQ